ncbi:ROK family transcriptional regulator [Varibaculum vaginae]|uniref:ROK family transcriptional regulator n=1 Tax=Varibaculum vaginae TaxID=2364797 RepID=UPI001F188CDC|nr:ROK family transcriptional regulator [Varibaculum vaginae]
MTRLFDDSALATVAHILAHGPLSRADTARDLELSPATLTRLVRPLMKSGMITEARSGVSKTGMGRPTQLLAVPPDQHAFIGVNLSGTMIHCVRTDTNAQILSREAVPVKSHDPDECLRQLCTVIRNQIGEGENPRLEGIGISLGGKINASNIKENRFLGWHDVDLHSLSDKIKSSSHPDIEFVNDVTGLTMLEQWFGLGRKCEDFVVTTIGAGIGNGMVHNLRAVRSPLSGLGTTSHIPLAGAHGVCQYGHVGCANGALTLPAVLSRAQAGRAITHRDSAPSSAEELIYLADRGDKSCRRAIMEFTENLAVYVQTVASAALVLDVVLDGEGVCLLESRWADNFDKHLKSYGRPDDPRIKVHRRSGSFDRWAQGAAVAAIVKWLIRAATSSIK